MMALERWMATFRENPSMSVSDIELSACAPWRFEHGTVNRPDGRFFRIIGISEPGRVQLFLDQPEVGLLGFVFADFDGTRHVLVQAKDEPGNEGLTQIAPTVQATKSNTERAHGGIEVPYVEAFDAAPGARVLNHSQSSEHGERFWKKQNRNMAILLSAAPAPVGDRYSWFPVADIAAALDEDFVVNTDARSVLAATPWTELCGPGRQPFDGASDFAHALSASFTSPLNDLDVANATALLAEARQRTRASSAAIALTPERLVDRSAHEWVRFIEVTSATREVSRWTQPIYETRGTEDCSLVLARRRGELVVIVRLAVEKGLRSLVEWSTTTNSQTTPKAVDDLLAVGRVVTTVRQTEEGSRFFHSHARFDIVDSDREINDDELRRDGLCAMSLGAFNQILGADGTTTNELRTAASLLLRWV